MTIWVSGRFLLSILAGNAEAWAYCGRRRLSKGIAAREIVVDSAERLFRLVDIVALDLEHCIGLL